MLQNLPEFTTLDADAAMHGDRLLEGSEIFHLSLTTPRPRHLRSAARLALGKDAALEAKIWRTVTGLLKASSSDMRTAQRALDLLGDPLRRTLLEQLARGPRKMSPTFLAEIGCNIGDCLHRIRALRREELIRRAKFQSYIINPHAVPPLCLYIDVLITAGSLSDEGFCMDFDIDLVLEALSSSTRRRLFESIVIKPRSIVQLVDMVPVTRQSVAQHVQVLLDAGLVQYEGKMVKATLSQLPRLRTYFDRLWLEASLGETWLSERYGDRMAALT